MVIIHHYPLHEPGSTRSWLTRSKFPSLSLGAPDDEIGLLLFGFDEAKWKELRKKTLQEEESESLKNKLVI